MYPHKHLGVVSCPIFSRGQYTHTHTQGKRLQTNAEGRTTVSIMSAELKILRDSALGPDHLCTTTPKMKAEENTEVLKSHAHGSERWVHLQVQWEKL